MVAGNVRYLARQAVVEVSLKSRFLTVLPNPELSRCRICGAAVRDFEKHMKTTHACLSHLSVLSRQQRAAQAHTVDARLMQGPIETATSGSGINYGSATRSGLLVGSDGIVIGRTAPAAGERDKSVVRSQSNTEDDWKE